MQLALQDFTALVRIQAAAVAAAARTLLDVSVGSVLRAVLEANASVALWVQWLIMEVLATTRAATSAGLDLDSWVADFGMSRLPAVAAVGEVTFSRVTPGVTALIPVGTLVRTGTGVDSQAFEVVGDAARAGWTGVGYGLGAGDAWITVPVRAIAAGRSGNVQAGVLTLLSSAVPGVDSVTNAYAASGGLDAESDAALRVRFGGFIDSRTRATEQAIAFALQGVQQGLQFRIVERMDVSGSIRPGHFTVVLDDGSGAPPDSLVEAAGAAIEAVRPIGGTYSVVRPVLERVDVTMRLEGVTDGGAAVRAAVLGYIAGLPIAGGVSVSRVIQVAHGADGALFGASGVLLNGVGADVFPSPFGRLVPGSFTVVS